MMRDRNQHVAFGVIARDRTAWQLVGDELQPAQMPLDVIAVVIGDKADAIPVGKTGFGDIIGVHQDDITRAFDATETVGIAVNCRIELVVRAHREQPVTARLVLETERIELWRRSDDRLAAVGLPDPLGGWIPAPEAARLEHPLVEVVKVVGVGRFDQVAHQRIIGRPLVPFQLGVLIQCGLGDAGNDFQLAFQMW